MQEMTKEKENKSESHVDNFVLETKNSYWKQILAVQ